MKSIKNIFTILLLTTGLVLSSCADLTVDNLNAPDRERALAADEDLESLLSGSTADVFWTVTHLFGININAYSDMMSTTNMVYSWWVFTDEPRREMPNVPTFSDLIVNSYFWSNFNAGVQTANTIIGVIEDDNKEIIVDGENITQKMLASAYFLRGVSKSYIGMIYDQGYNIFPETDLTTLEIVSYDEILEAGLADLEEAVTLANGATAFTWDLLPTPDSWDIDEFETITYSIAARALAAKARTSSDADAMDWQRVLDYANRAAGGDNAAADMDGFIATSVAEDYYNQMKDWHTYRVGSPGYLPPDIMVQHTLDPEYPTSYPVEAGVFLTEEDYNPTDPRSSYHGYTPERFAQSADRNKALFTQYYFLREFADNQWWQHSGYPIVYYLSAETDYIKTEAYLRLGDKVSAADVLNQSPFGSGVTDFSPDLPAKTLGYISENGLSGGNTILATASDAEFQFALLREYAVEISLMGGVGNQWFFMRRWDMLQEGTPLHYPIPANELEITDQPFYTFGGVSNAGQPGTASGANSWTDLAEKIDSGTAFFNKTQTQSQSKQVKSSSLIEMNSYNSSTIGKDTPVRVQ